MIKDVTFGGLMHDLRMRNNMTLREYCRRSKQDSGNYSKMERGLRWPPDTQKELLALTKCLNPTELDMEFLECACLNFHQGRIINTWFDSKAQP